MRTDLTASDLRSAACRSEEVAQARRLLAIALVLEGVSRRQAAAQTGMDRQTLRDWAHRYNEAGIEGLRSRRSPGRAHSLTAPQKAELKALVTQGADPKRDGVVLWRCVELQREIARRFAVEVHGSTVGKWLHQFGLTRLQLRPFHPKRDLEKQETFKKRMARPVCKWISRSCLISLRQRIRSRGIAPAKMEIRASRSS
jgi:transposase